MKILSSKVYVISQILFFRGREIVQEEDEILSQVKPKSLNSKFH